MPTICKTMMLHRPLNIVFWLFFCFEKNYACCCCKVTARSQSYSLYDCLYSFSKNSEYSVWLISTLRLYSLHVHRPDAKFGFLSVVSSSLKYSFSTFAAVILSTIILICWPFMFATSINSQT